MNIFQTLDRQDRQYARRRFRGPVRTSLASMILNIREMRKLEEQVLEGSDETVMAFKSSHLNNVGIVAVASALTSQLSSTTLQTPGMADIHWSASGFIVTALLCGVLATMLACASQQLLGLLNSPRSVRMWLSNGHFYHPHHNCHPQYNARVEEVDPQLFCHYRQSLGRGQQRRLQVSIASMGLLGLPLQFLVAAFVCFLLGFGLYLGYAMKQNLDTAPGRDNNKAVLVLFLVVASVALTIASMNNVWKMREVDAAERVWEKGVEEDQEGKENDDGKDHHGNGSGTNAGRRRRKAQELYQTDDGQDQPSCSDRDGDERAKLLREQRTLKSRNASSDRREAKRHGKIAEAMERVVEAHRELARLLER